MTGRIAKLLSFIRVTRNGARISDVKINPGGGRNVTAEHFASPGDDSHPLTSDYVLSVSVPRQGGEAVAGYLDPINTPRATPGDKRIYARNASNGATIVELWLKSDGSAILSNDSGSVTLGVNGSITGSNDNGSFALQVGGNFVVNGAIIDTSGNISSPGDITAIGTASAATVAATTSLTVGSKEMSTHTHSQANDSGGSTEANTSGPL